MAFRPAPIPQDTKSLAGFIDRELNRLANAFAAMLETAMVRFTGGPTITTGAGTPEGAITANPGSVHLRTDGGAGTSLYVKESGTGATGWVAK